MALSSTEAEYVPMAQVIWLRKLLKDLGVPADKQTVLFKDNQGYMKLYKKYKVY